MIQNIILFIIGSIILLITGGYVTYAWYIESYGIIKAVGMFYTILMTLLGVFAVYVAIFGEIL